MDILGAGEMLLMSATDVFRYCLGTGKTNKACPWATMVWVSQLRTYLPIWIRIH